MPYFRVMDERADTDEMERFSGKLRDIACLPRRLRDEYARRWHAGDDGPPKVAPSRAETVVAWWRNDVQFVAVEPSERGFRVVLYDRGIPTQTTGYFDEPEAAIKVAERCYGRSYVGLTSPLR